VLIWLNERGSTPLEFSSTCVDEFVVDVVVDVVECECSVCTEAFGILVSVDVDSSCGILPGSVAEVTVGI